MLYKFHFSSTKLVFFKHLAAIFFNMLIHEFGRSSVVLLLNFYMT
jgi:hypothetical protein